jgi:GT2 family glycosyltransferase
MTAPSAELVSVVIVSWNARDYLLKCLRTLLAQVAPFPLEVIVVDNASADGSVPAVRAEFPSVRIIELAENLGFSKANNIGLAAAAGEILCLINSDVELRPNSLAPLIDALIKNPSVGLLGPRVIGGDGHLQRSCRGHPTLWNQFCRALALDAICPRLPLFTGYLLSHWPHDDTRQVEILSGCFWVARRSALQQVGPLDEAFFMYGEDMDWCLRYGKAGWALLFVAEVEIVHYGGASSANAPLRFFLEKERAFHQYWKKHHSFASYCGFVPITLLYHLLRALGHAGASLVCHAAASRDHRFKARRSAGCLRWIASLPDMNRKIELR